MLNIDTLKKNLFLMNLFLVNKIFFFYYSTFFEYVIKKDENEMLVENNDTGDILCCYSENLNSLHIISRKKLENIWNVFSIKSIQECRKNLMINSIILEEMPEYFHFTNFF